MEWRGFFHFCLIVGGRTKTLLATFLNSTFAQRTKTVIHAVLVVLTAVLRTLVHAVSNRLWRVTLSIKGAAAPRVDDQQEVIDIDVPVAAGGWRDLAGASFARLISLANYRSLRGPTALVGRGGRSRRAATRHWGRL